MIVDTAVVCRLCGAVGGRVVSRRSSFRAIRCTDCSFVTLRSGIDENTLTDAYQDYLPQEAAAVRVWEQEQRPVIQRAARKIQELAPRGRLLDLGCGYGFFLREMQRRGFEVEGLEVSAIGREYARREFGIPVHAESLEDRGYGERVFDVVTAFYVIEHVPDPRSFLREVFRVLRPGGLAFLRWPHSTPIARVLDTLRIPHDVYHRPWHLSDFSPATMEWMFDHVGFRRVETRTLGGTGAGNFLGNLLSRGSAWCSDGIEWISRGQFHLPGVSKTTWGFRP